MREVLDAVAAWSREGVPVALATVVGVVGSGPRPVGTVMAVASDGRLAGNVSAGCVESAVVADALAVLGDGAPRRTRYGISDEQALAVGLTCGGEIEVVVTPVDEAAVSALRDAGEDIAAGRPVALAMTVAGDAAIGAVLAVTPSGAAGNLGSDGLGAAVIRDAQVMLARGETGVRTYAPDGTPGDEIAVLIRSLAPPPRMMIFGGIDIAAALATLGSFLGYRVTVCDAREGFATPQRFPNVDELVVEWPHRYLERSEVDERTVICVLTHDAKFDIPLLLAALQTPAAYIGVMGSRRSREDRWARLRAEGVTDDQLARLRMPTGLDLGAQTPEETAVSMAAEIIALRTGGSGNPLRDATGPIHHRVGVR